MSAESANSQNSANIRHAYQKCLKARHMWLSVRNRTAQDVPREAAHSNLHESVLAWFEALVPFIAERPGEVKQLWESAPLFPEEPETVAALVCPNGHAYEREEADFGPGDVCPRSGCGYPLEPEERHATDDDGRQLYKWACGLKRLATWQNKTKEVRVDGDSWESGTSVKEVPQRLDPSVLMRAARYLDLAAEEVGLLEDTNDALPTGEL